MKNYWNYFKLTWFSEASPISWLFFQSPTAIKLLEKQYVTAIVFCVVMFIVLPFCVMFAKYQGRV